MTDRYVYWKDGDTDCWALTPEKKHEAIRSYASVYNTKWFVETGTFEGDTIEAMYNQFDFLISIELSEKYYQQARERFKDITNISILQGDSPVILKEILYLKDDIWRRLPRTLFWLDAHCSGGETAGGIHPIVGELTAIFESGVEGVILVDDCQDFWKNGVPELAEETAEKYRWSSEILDGIMRITK